MAAHSSTSRRRFLLGGLGLGVAGVGALVLGSPTAHREAETAKAHRG